MERDVTGENRDFRRDPLTGLSDGTELLHCARAAQEQHREGQDPPALLVVDLDGFKAVVDGAGHKTGNLVLQRVAKRLRDASGSDMLVARLWADEFAILMPDGAEAERLAERLLAVIRRPYAVGGQIVNISASLGIAMLAPGQAVEEWIGNASIAVREAQRGTRGRRVTFADRMRESASRRFVLDRDLRSAVTLLNPELRYARELSQFVLEYQPHFHLQSRRLAGFEALIRWFHPERGRVGPDEFIPVAERTGLICTLGTWILRTACQAAVQWPACDGGQPLLSVNVSPLQIAEGNSFIQSLREVLRGSGLPPTRLVLEITESAALPDALPVFEEIRAMGIQLSIDDFGTGFSSLGHLARFGFDRLKIDRSFVRDLSLFSSETATPVGNGTLSRSDQAVWIVRAITGLAQGLGLSTLA